MVKFGLCALLVTLSALSMFVLVMSVLFDEPSVWYKTRMAVLGVTLMASSILVAEKWQPGYVPPDIRRD